MIYKHLFTTEDIPAPFCGKREEAARKMIDERLLIMMILFMMKG